MSREDARFRVSDVQAIPLGGTLLRLTLLDGTPKVKSFGKSKLRLVGPDGEERTVGVRGLSIMGGRPKQSHIERYRMLDVLISREDAAGNGTPVRIGWTAVGPV